MNLSFRRGSALGGAFAIGVALAGAVVTAPAQAAPIQPSAVQSASALAQSAANAVVSARASFLHASADDAFVQRQVISSGGVQYVPYERTYKGLPVVGGDFVIVTDSAGSITATSVAQEQTIALAGVTPSLSRASAEQTARQQLATVDRVEGSRLVVFAKGTPRLAWESTVAGTGSEGASRLVVDVDAATGAVLETTEKVMRGTGTGGYNGPSPLSIATTQSGSSYLLQDPAMTTLRCQDSANNTTFTGPDDVWGNGNDSNRETGCVDALFGAQKQKAMLSGWLGRNGFNGSGGAWPIRVGLNQVNAYYDGTQIQIGHNQDATPKWISSMDVVAHEFGHGIDDTTPGGISRSGTQEFIGDAFGAATEAYANEPAPYDVPDYLVGESINLVGQGPIRNMYNPSLVGDPNCYSSSIPSTEVHAAAGPGNHWFYLASEGNAPAGKPASPICSGGPSSVTGIGVQSTMKILYNAMLMKTSTSSYLKYRTWTLTAAKNLFPSGCTEFNAIKAAWDAVSVPAQTGDPTCSGTPGAPTANNPGNQTGTVGTAVSLQLTATGGTAPLTWSATGLPAGLSISGSGLITGTPTTAATSTVTATVTDSGSRTGTTSFTWTISSAPTPGCSGTNGTDFTIADNATVESPITIGGCAGNASSTASVEVHIVHTYIGDLVVSLVAPDGSAYVVHNRAGGSADNINQTYTVNLSTEVANGTWKLRVQDAASGDVGRIDTWTLNTGGGGTPACGGTNGTDVAIPDNTTVTSTIAVSGCSGNASATSTVEVHIVHTYIGDLVVSLVAPDGSAYVLHNRAGGSADNINQTYTVNLSTEVRNGTWTLRVQDAASNDIGRIDTWTLTL